MQRPHPLLSISSFICCCCLCSWLTVHLVAWLMLVCLLAKVNGCVNLIIATRSKWLVIKTCRHADVRHERTWNDAAAAAVRWLPTLVRYTFLFCPPSAVCLDGALAEWLKYLSRRGGALRLVLQEAREIGSKWVSLWIAKIHRFLCHRSSSSNSTD